MWSGSLFGRLPAESAWARLSCRPYDQGVGLARKVRSEYPVIKIVLTSGHLAALDWVDHDGFFPKPYDTDRLIQHIKTLLD